MADGDNNCFIETASCAFIWVPLDDDDCTIVAATPSFVTTGATSIAVTNEIEQGTDYSAKGMDGRQCGPRLKGDDVIKWKNIAGTLCVKNLAMLSAMDGNPTVVDANDHVIGRESLIGGASASSSVCNTTAAKPKGHLVIARKASDSDGGCGVGASTSGMTGLMAHFFPLITNVIFEDETFEDARASYAFTAQGYSNPAIGRGAWNLWPTTAVPTSPSDTSGHSEVLIDPSSFPTPSCNPQAHPAVVAPVLGS